MNLQTIKQRFGIIGNSAQLNYALSVAERVASTNLSVLIAGESGTGKEVFSQIIHQLSPRKHNKFIAVNCGAIPEGTIDSELFGHEKGSFTGAHEKRTGYFETVDGGTIFLDEIGEMPIGTQARLLRVLESGEFLKVGSSKVQKTDVRVVAATNVNLLENIKKGKFREDLYYRLSTVPIEIPPLRERGNDILVLFRKFASDFAEKNRVDTIRLSEDAQKMLLSHEWPGNVRQLKNMSEQLSVLADSRSINAENIYNIIPDIQRRNLPKTLSVGNNSSSEGDSFSEREILYKIMFDLKKDVNDLKQFVLQMAKSSKFSNEQLKHFSNVSDMVDYKDLVSTEAQEESREPVIINHQNENFAESEEVEEMQTLADMEKKMVINALKKYSGKRKDAAQELGVSERTLYRKIKEYKLDL